MCLHNERSALCKRNNATKFGLKGLCLEINHTCVLEIMAGLNDEKLSALNQGGSAGRVLALCKLQQEDVSTMHKLKLKVAQNNFLGERAKIRLLRSYLIEILIVVNN